MQVVAIAREAGVVHLGALAVDGSKVTAHASKHKAMSDGRKHEEARRLREQTAARTAQAAATDAAEDAERGPDVRGDELPAEVGLTEDLLSGAPSSQPGCHPLHSGWRSRQAAASSDVSKLGCKNVPWIAQTTTTSTST